MVTLFAPAVYWLAWKYLNKDEGRARLTVVGLSNECINGTVLLRAGVEDQLVSRDTPVTHGTGHVIRWTVDDEIAKQGLTLPEGTVVGIGWIKLIQTIEEVLLGIWEELLQIHLRALGCQLGLIAEVEAFVAVAVDDEWHFGEVSLLPFVAGKVTDDVSINRGTVVEIAVAIDADWLCLVGGDVRLLSRGLQCCLIEATKALYIIATCC